MAVYRWAASSGSFGFGSNWSNTTLKINPARTPPGVNDSAEFFTSGGTITGSGSVGGMAFQGTLGAPLSIAAQLRSASSLVAGATELVAGGTWDAGTLSVVSGGRLSVLDGGALQAGSIGLTGSAVLAVSGTGSAVVGGGAALAGALTVAGSLTGAGTVNATGGIVDGGVIAASGGTLRLAGPVSGGGSLLVGDGATLSLGGLSAVSVAFTGPGATLEVLSLSVGGTSVLSEKGVITGFTPGETIRDADDAPVTGAVYAAAGAGLGTLTLLNGSTPLGILTLAGAFDGYDFSVAQHGTGGTDITLTAHVQTPVPVAVPDPLPPVVDVVPPAPHDTLTISEDRRGALVSLLGNGNQTISHGGQIDTTSGLANVQFLDGREVFDPDDPAAQVLRLYQAALGRAPDQPGLHGWTGALQAGGHLSDVATAFLDTPEFAARFGAAQGTAGFVTALYQNALGRAPDAAGLASWTSAIDSGQQTRAQVLVGFSESAENHARTQSQVAAGIWDVSEGGSEVARLYDTALGRLPDAGGFNGWVTALNGGSSLQSLANAFVISPEFTRTYGALDNAGFVQALYQNTLHRAGDAAGLAGWTNALGGGATRAQVVVGFSESAEHQASTAPNIMSNDPAQYGIKLT